MGSDTISEKFGNFGTTYLPVRDAGPPELSLPVRGVEGSVLRLPL